MSRSAQDVLEFDKLRELLRLRTTCAPGRRAVEELEFSRNAEFLQKQFALIKEAREWLRVGNELGFGGLADPEMWLEKIAGVGVALEAKELIEAASLLETASWLRTQFREESCEISVVERGGCGGWRFSRGAGGDPAMHIAERRNQRRCFADVAADSREHGADAGIDSENAEADFAFAQCGGR